MTDENQEFMEAMMKQMDDAATNHLKDGIYIKLVNTPEGMAVRVMHRIPDISRVIGALELAKYSILSDHHFLERDEDE